MLYQKQCCDVVFSVETMNKEELSWFERDVEDFDVNDLPEIGEDIDENKIGNGSFEFILNIIF